MKPANASGAVPDDLRNPFEHLLQRYQEDPSERAKSTTVRSFTQDAYKDGMLARVLEKAGDAILSAAEIRQLLMGAYQAKTPQELEELKIPFEVLVAAISDEAVVTQFTAAGNTLGPSVFFMFAPLLADSAVNLIIKALEPQYPQIPPKTLKTLEAFLQTLIGLKLQIMPEAELQALFPAIRTLNPQTFFQQIKQLADAKLQITVPNYTQTNPVAVKQALEQAKAEFEALVAVAESEGMDTSTIAQIKNMPEQGIMLLNQAAPAEKSWVAALLGVFVSNRQVVHAAVLQRPYEELKSRKDAVKATWDREVSVSMTEEEEKKLALIDQLLLCPPILANYLIIKQLLNDLEDRINELKSKTLSLTKILLFRACFELCQIASGKASVEYHHVGVMHTEIERLVKKIDALLPKKPQELTTQNAAALTQAIIEHLGHIKHQSPSTLSIILKSHPRMLLYLLYSHSPVLEDISIPYCPSYTPELFSALEQALQKLWNLKGFSRYQPKVLQALIEESKKEPTSELSKSSLRVVYKAINDMIATLDPKDAETFVNLLRH